MLIKVINEGEQSGLSDFADEVKPLCDRDCTVMVVVRKSVDFDSSFPAHECPACGRLFTLASAYFIPGSPMERHRISCANDGMAMALTKVAEEGETWSCPVEGCGRVELHSRDRE